jgi:hypothetical protein
MISQAIRLTCCFRLPLVLGGLVVPLGHLPAPLAGRPVLRLCPVRRHLPDRRGQRLVDGRRERVPRLPAVERAGGRVDQVDREGDRVGGVDPRLLDHARQVVERHPHGRRPVQPDGHHRFRDEAALPAEPDLQHPRDAGRVTARRLLVPHRLFPAAERGDQPGGEVGPADQPELLRLRGARVRLHGGEQPGQPRGVADDVFEGVAGAQPGRLPHGLLLGRPGQPAEPPDELADEPHPAAGLVLPQAGGHEVVELVGGVPVRRVLVRRPLLPFPLPRRVLDGVRTRLVEREGGVRVEQRERPQQLGGGGHPELDALVVELAVVKNRAVRLAQSAT